MPEALRVAVVDYDAGNTLSVTRALEKIGAVVELTPDPDRVVNTFQAVIQGDGRVAAARAVGAGVHGGGHYAISGDPGGDFYFSPLEPGFYLHHGNIDRMHFIWQNLDWEKRQVCVPFLCFTDGKTM